MQEDFILKLMDRFDNSNIVSLQISKDNTTISLSKSQSVQPQVIQNSNSQNNSDNISKVDEKNTSETKNIVKIEEPKDNSIEIKSPIVGTFYRSPSPDSLAYAEVGKKVTKGQPLCILEAMKMMNTLEAEYDCIIDEILVTNGDLVEFDQPILRVHKI